MIDPTKTTPEKLAEMCDSLMADNAYLREQLELTRAEVDKVLGWYNEAMQKRHDT